MIYRLHLYTPAQQLAILDQVASVGFKVLYEMPQMDDCDASASPNDEWKCAGLTNTSTPGYQLLNDTVHLIKHHPALLGYCALLGYSCQQSCVRFDNMDVLLILGACSRCCSLARRHL